MKVLVLFSSCGDIAFPPAFFMVRLQKGMKNSVQVGDLEKKKKEKKKSNKNKTETMQKWSQYICCETSLLISICLVELHYRKKFCGNRGKTCGVKRTRRNPLFLFSYFSRNWIKKSKYLVSREVMLFPAAMPAHILAFPYIHFHLQTAKHTPEDGKLPVKNLKHIQTRLTSSM